MSQPSSIITISSCYNSSTSFVLIQIDLERNYFLLRRLTLDLLNLVALGSPDRQTQASTGPRERNNFRHFVLAAGEISVWIGLGLEAVEVAADHPVGLVVRGRGKYFPCLAEHFVIFAHAASTNTPINRIFD